MVVGGGGWWRPENRFLKGGGGWWRVVASGGGWWRVVESFIRCQIRCVFFCSRGCIWQYAGFLRLCFCSFLFYHSIFFYGKRGPSWSRFNYRWSRVVVVGKTKAAPGCFRSFRWRLLRLKGPFSRRQYSWRTSVQKLAIYQLEYTTSGIYLLLTIQHKLSTLVSSSTTKEGIHRAAAVICMQSLRPREKVVPLGPLDTKARFIWRELCYCKLWQRHLSNHFKNHGGLWLVIWAGSFAPGHFLPKTT